MTYTLECSKGHALATSKVPTRCPAYVQGQPCDGHLHAVGEGARTANRQLAGAR